jgi:hypothetical protein
MKARRIRDTRTWPRRRPGQQAEIRHECPRRAVVGQRVVRRAASRASRRVDDRRLPAIAALRSGGRYGQRPGRDGHHRPVGNDPGLRYGRRVRNRDRAGLAAGPHGRAAGPDGGGNRGRPGRGVPGAHGRRRPGIARPVGDSRPRRLAGLVGLELVTSARKAGLAERVLGEAQSAWPFVVVMSASRRKPVGRYGLPGYREAQPCPDL